jgi:hypothetical protein
MTDDEINRKVAEIEGWQREEICTTSGYLDEVRWHRSGLAFYPGLNGVIPIDEAPPFATDWAWCGPLIENHKISILPFCEKWGANPFAHVEGTQYADSPQRAICLAVIATHGQPADPGIWTGLGDK